MDHADQLYPEPYSLDSPIGEASATSETAPESVAGAVSRAIGKAPARRRSRTMPKPQPEGVVIDPALVLQMRAALATPALRVKPKSDKKPTASAIVSQLRPMLEALRAGTAPVCNGRPMSWRQIAERLATTTGLSGDSFRKAWGNETGERLLPPPRARRISPGRRLEKPDLTTRALPATPVATPSSVGSSPADFGPLFDD